VLLAFAIALASVAIVTASGPVGIYGIVEKVVFEPNDRAPERVQVWGAFAYVDGNNPQGTVVSNARRGYLYFKLPTLMPGFIDQAQIDNVKKEWADLKTVAGTGQAVGFGRWHYIAGFGSLQPDARPVAPSVILENVPRGGAQIDLRVRPESEAPAAPATYQTNTGLVKLSESGSHAAIVKALKDAIK
jgi:hypothetical protein